MTVTDRKALAPPLHFSILTDFLSVHKPSQFILIDCISSACAIGSYSDAIHSMRMPQAVAAETCYQCRNNDDSNNSGDDY